MANIRDYRVPTIDDDPNVPVWMDRLAEDVAADVDVIDGVVTELQELGPSETELLAPARAWVEVELDQHGAVISGTLSDGTRVVPVLESTTATVAALTTAGMLTSAVASVDGEMHLDVDLEGRKLESALGPDGCVPQWVLDRWKARMGVFATPVRSVVGWGDSLTAWTTSWPVHLATILATLRPGVAVHQRGVGGETSTGIAARQGALPYLVLPVAGAIPAATTPAEVTLTSAGGGASWPLLRGNAFPIAMTGTLAGVPGTLTKDPATPWNQSDVHLVTDKYYFTRTTAGTAVTLTRPAALVLDDATARKGDVPVIWAGRNGPANARVLSDIQAMVNNRAPQDASYLVLSVTNGAGEGTGTGAYTTITSLNASLLAEYGRRYLDVRRYLIDYGLADLGITPTTQDTTDVAADTIPASLRVDAIHLTTAAQLRIAQLIADRLIEIGAI